MSNAHTCNKYMSARIFRSLNRNRMAGRKRFPFHLYKILLRSKVELSGIGILSNCKRRNEVQNRNKNWYPSNFDKGLMQYWFLDTEGSRRWSRRVKLTFKHHPTKEAFILHCKIFPQLLLLRCVDTAWSYNAASEMTKKLTTVLFQIDAILLWHMLQKKAFFW